MAAAIPYMLFLVSTISISSAQIGNCLFYILWALTRFESVNNFVELGRHFLSHFFPHLAHHLSHGFGIIFESFEAREIIRHAIHAALLRFRNADFRYAAAHILAATVCAGDGLFTVFAVGEEHVEALIAVIADEVVGGHDSILTESGSDV